MKKRDDLKSTTLRYKGMYVYADDHRDIKVIATARGQTMIGFIQALIKREKAIHDAGA